ncbi:MAG: leucine-rich repeat protein [Coriobacteriales bacterium]
MRLKTVARAVFGALIACSLCAVPAALAEEAVPGGSAPVVQDPSEVEQIPPSVDGLKGDTTIKNGVKYTVTKISTSAIEKGSCEAELTSFKGSGSSFKVPATVTYIAGGYGPLKLKVTSIAKGAFDNAKGHKLKSVTIGENVSAIGDGAFKGCKKLTKITMKGTKLKSVGPNTGSINRAKLTKLMKKWKTCSALKGVPRACIVYVPKPKGDDFGPVENVRQLVGYAGFKGVVSW